MTELAWIDAAISAARPRALAALLRYFRDLDIAEEAVQDACLRASTLGLRPVRRVIPRLGSSWWGETLR